MGSESEDAGERVDVELESRALLKYFRAGELFESLEADIDRWNEEHQLLAPVRSPHEGEQRLEFFRPSELDHIPLARWESTFHDGVHNLRVALDTLCFELCHLEEDPSEPGRIYFPITDHPNDWPERTKYLSTIPSEVLDRLRACQPWGRPDPQNPDPLRLISRIDNVNKHRAAGVSFDVVPIGQWELRPAAPLPQELAESNNWPLAPWMQLTISPPMARGTGQLLPVAAIPYVFFEGLYASLPDAQRWLHSEVKRAIDFIASGVWPAAGFSRVIPGPLWSVFPGP